MDREEAFRMMANGHLEGAYPALKSLRDEYPQDWMIYERLAYIETNLTNNFDEASKLIQEAEALGCPKAECHRMRADVFWKQGQLDRAIIELEEAVMADRTLENLRALADGLMHTDFVRAVPVWEQIIQKDPSYGKAYLALAWIARREGNLNRALEMATKAKQLTRNDPKVSFDLGSVHQDLEEYEKALGCYTQASQLGLQDKFLIHYGMASCYVGLGNYVGGLTRGIRSLQG